MAETISILDVVGKNVKRRDEDRPQIRWINARDLEPGLEIEGRIVTVKPVTIQSKFGAERDGRFVLIETEEGELVGLRFPYAMFVAVVDAAQLKRDDRVKIKYLGTVAQMQLIDKDTYKKLKELNFNDNTKLFEIEVLYRAPEPEQEEVDKETKELIEQL